MTLEIIKADPKDGFAEADVGVVRDNACQLAKGFALDIPDPLKRAR
jgi:hypothetical protein